MRKFFARSIAVILCFVMMITFVPFLGSAGQAYAGNYEEHDVQWVKDNIWGLLDVRNNSNYSGDYVAVAGTTLNIDRYEVAKQLGYNSEYNRTESCYVEWFYKTSKTGSRNLISRAVLDGTESTECVMPANAKKGWYLQVVIWDDCEGAYYYSSDIPIEPKDKKLLTSLGGGYIIFDSDTFITSDYDTGPLLNTFLIAAEEGTVNVDVIDEFEYDFDIDKDGSADFKMYNKYFDVYEDYDEPYFRTYLNVLDHGSKEVVIYADPNKGFPDKVFEYGGTYYENFVFVLPGKDISGMKFKLSKIKLEYNGKKRHPGVTVTDGDVKLVEDADYEVTGSRKSVGPGAITIKGIGDYSGTKTLHFEVVPKGTTLKSVSRLYKGFKAVWKKQTLKTSGYEICYATNSKFKNSHAKKIYGATKSSGSVKKLKGKKYYVKVRTFKKVDGRLYYSKWSKVKIVRPKR